MSLHLGIITCALLAPTAKFGFAAVATPMICNKGSQTKEKATDQTIMPMNFCGNLLDFGIFSRYSSRVKISHKMAGRHEMKLINSCGRMGHVDTSIDI